MTNAPLVLSVSQSAKLILVSKSCSCSVNNKHSTTIHIHLATQSRGTTGRRGRRRPQPCTRWRHLHRASVRAGKTALPHPAGLLIECVVNGKCYKRLLGWCPGCITHTSLSLGQHPYAGLWGNPQFRTKRNWGNAAEVCPRGTLCSTCNSNTSVWSHLALRLYCMPLLGMMGITLAHKGSQELKHLALKMLGVYLRSLSWLLGMSRQVLWKR